MQPVEVIVIIAAAAFVCLVVASAIYKKVKHKGHICDCCSNCDHCCGCSKVDKTK